MKFGIRWKIILVIEAAVLVVALSCAAVALTLQRTALVESTNNKLQSISVLKEYSIQRFTSHALAEMGHIANGEETGLVLRNFLKEKTAQQKQDVYEVLHEISEEKDIFSGVFLLDTEGVIVASINQQDEGKIRSRESFFLNGKTAPIIHDFYYDAAVERTELISTTPLFGNDGSLLGVLASKLTLGDVSEILAEKSGLGATGETFLVNYRSLVITDLRKEEGAALKKTLFFLPQIEHCLSGNSTLALLPDYRGDLVYGYWHWFPEMQSCLVTKVDQSEALAPLGRITTLLVGIIGLIIVLVGVAGYAFGQSLVRPLLRLRDVATRVQGGDYTQILSTKSTDEIGEIASVFNVMVKHLETYTSDLEEKVSERTLALNAKITEVEKSKQATINLLEDISREKDISEKRAIELEKFQLAVANTSEHIIITDSDGVILYANQAVSEITGYSNDEIIGQKPSLWGKQMPKEYYEEMWRTIKAEKKTLKSELQNRRKNGEIYTAQAVISPVLDKFGAVRFFVAMESDISARIALEHSLIEEKIVIEEKVVARTRELKEEQARLLTSINSLTLGFILASREHRFFLHNQATENLFGLSDTEVTLEHISQRIEAKTNLREVIEKCLDDRGVCEINEIVFGDKFLRLIIAPVRVFGDEEKVIGYVLLFEDITEAKILDRSRDEFFSIASHELRTPLTAIRGNSSMLQEFYSDKVDDPEFREIVGDILVSSERLIRIVNDFLSVSRLEQKRMEFKLAPFDLLPIIHGTIKEIAEIASKKNIGLEFAEPVTTLPFAFADSDRVKQALFNLIGNAINYTAEGKVSVSLSVTQGFLKVFVEDTGVGISAENQGLLFRKFQQANEKILTRNVTQGTGLGLYISKLMIEKMGGVVVIERSEPGKGSVFSFTIPVAES